MALNFPNLPSNGQSFQAAGREWIWDGTSWKLQGTASSYVLPIAGVGVTGELGGVKIGSGLQINATTGLLDATGTGGGGGIDLTDLSVTQNLPSGTGTLSYNSNNGVFTYTPPSTSSGVDLTAFSVTQQPATGTGNLTYNNGNGVFEYTPPDLSSFLTSLPSHSLNDHTDVVITGTPADGAVLKYDSGANSGNGAWIVGSDNVSGGGSGVGSLQQVTDQGNTTTNSITTGGLVVGSWNGGNEISVGDSQELEIYHQDSTNDVFFVIDDNNDAKFFYPGNGEWIIERAGNNVLFTTTADGIKIKGSFEDKDGSYGTTGQILSSTGTELKWIPAPSGGGGGGIDLTDLSVSSNSASGGGSLSYNNSTGIFTYTPPDLSSYLTGLPSHTHSLVGLDDTSLINSDSPSDGDSLVYRSSDQKWRPVAISGGGGGGIDLTDLSATVNPAGTTDFSYNNTTGVFTYTPPDLSGYALAAHNHTYALNDLSNVNVASPTDGHVLKYDVSAFGGSGGWISAPDQTSTGGAGISLTDLSVTQAAASAGGSLSYNNTNGVFTYTPPALNTYGDTDARGALSVVVQSAGTANLEYNSSTGVFTYTPPTISNYTNQDARGAISLITNAASGGGSLSYNNSTGAFTYAPADLSGLSTPDLSAYVKKTDTQSLSVTRTGASSYIKFDGASYFAVDVDAQIQFDTSAQFQVDAANQITLDAGTYVQTKSQWIEFKDSAGSNSLFRADAGSSVVLFNNGTWRLETKGDGVKINGGIQDKDGDLGTPGQVLSSTGTGLDWINPGSMSKSDLSVVVQSPGTANLEYNDSSGVFTYTPPTIVNYTNQNARGALSVTVQSAGTPNLTYNNSTGVFTYTPPNITSYSDQDARGSISLSKLSANGGGDLDYNGSTGVFTYKPADVQTGSRQSLSVQNAAAASTAQLAYNSSTGLFTYTPLNTTGLGGLQATRVSQWANSPYTASNPYNPNIDGQAEGFLVIIIGGGGGAGISLGTSSQGSASGGGGGAGSVLWFYSPAEMGTACYWSIGGGGSSPTSGLNAGTNGGTSYFYTNGSGPNLTAYGGQGSQYSDTSNFSSGGGAGGSGAWVTIGNDTNCVMRGSNGDSGIAVSNNSSCHSGQAGYAVQGPGTSGSNWGRGAWGAKSNNSNWGSANGNALGGIITIYKF